MPRGRRELMGSAAGSELRAAREHAGLTLAEASRRTRIPERYLDALEQGDLSVFPKGPFLSGYTRQYRAFLLLPDAPAPERDPPPRAEATAPRPARAAIDPGHQPEPTATGPAVPGSRTRRRAARLAALGAVTAVVVILGVQLTRRLWPGEAETVGEAPDQRVSLAVVEPRRVRIDVDGRRTLDGQLKPGPARVFAGHDQISLELETLEGVTVAFDGRTLTPLGARSRPRRLVFIDDAGR